jgi:porin
MAGWPIPSDGSRTTAAPSVSRKRRRPSTSAGSWLFDFFKFVRIARPKDKFGIAAAYAHVSPRVRALNQDYRDASGPAWPVRRFEALLTSVYQYEVRPGWTLQPNLQYIWHPGGGAASPASPFAGKRLKDAAVLGLRTVLKF